MKERPSWLSQEDVELIKLGTKTGNVGITRLQARRSLLDPIGYEILVEVFNASDEAASFRLELDLDDDPIDVVPLTLPAGERDGPGLREDFGRRRTAPRPYRPWSIPCRPTTPPGRSCRAALDRR